MSNNIGTTEKELIEVRKQKLAKIREAGIDPYPSVSGKNEDCDEIVKNQKELISLNKKVVTAGRIVALRGHGKMVFADLVDQSGKIQLVLKADTLAKDFELVSLLDLGDFVEAAGIVFVTEAGETSIQVSNLKILTKSLRPLPEKWHGLKDQELRYRERYIDLLTNPEVKEKFYIRSKIVETIRQFLISKNFLEVDTPVLQSIAGGASAKPFKTHYNAYDRDVFLRIAPELYHKRLIVGGFERVFEFARCFRNEGVDASHNPEFTNVEFYWAYADYEKMMELVEVMVKKIVFEINNGNLTMEILASPTGGSGQKIDFDKKFEVKTFAELTGGEKTDGAFKESLQKIIQPTFIINHPTELIPLAKRNAKDTAVVDSFQLVIGGLELAKAFSELNNPLEQKERFLEQMKMREQGDEEAQIMDEDFLKAIEYGMPPTSGCGIGIDRLTRLLTDSKTLREIIFFPFMRPDQPEAGKQN